MILELGKRSHTMTNLGGFVKVYMLLLVLILTSASGYSQNDPAQKVQPAEGAASAKPGENASYPELVDITASTGIEFEHLSSPEQKFIVESMSGGVAIIDYDGDGWPDIYFTNAQNVDMALHGKKARSVLYRNNHDGTF